MTRHKFNGDDVAWHVSTRSASYGHQCVEVGLIDDGSGRVAVRDSKDRMGPVLIFTRTAWLSFIESVREGEFDLHSN